MPDKNIGIRIMILCIQYSFGYLNYYLYLQNTCYYQICFHYLKYIFWYAEYYFVDTKFDFECVKILADQL